MSLRVVIADDEPLARKRAARLLARIGGVEVVGEAGDGRHAAALVRSLASDVLLLDIHMPELDGFETVAELGEAAPVVIFVTAFDHHASRAFDVSAADYVVKPIEEGRLRAALDKARTALASRSQAERIAELEATIRTLRSSLASGARRPLDLWIPGRDGFTRLPAAQLDWLQSERDYVRLHTGDRSYLYSETLASLERRLPADEFIRIHRSALVRRDRIAAMRRGQFGSLTAILADGRQLRVGRTYEKRVRAELANRG